MTWGKDWRSDDEVADLALVARRDGRNFDYGRQLGYAGLKAVKDSPISLCGIKMLLYWFRANQSW